MSGLADLQHALDVFGAAVYWHIADPSLEASALADKLGKRAEAAGCSDDQIADAGQYANQRAHRGEKPLLAGYSFADFQSKYGW